MTIFAFLPTVPRWWRGASFIFVRSMVHLLHRITTLLFSFSLLSPCRLQVTFALMFTRAGADIQGMGPSVVKELINFSLLRNYDDIFTLHKHKEVPIFPFPSVCVAFFEIMRVGSPGYSGMGAEESFLVPPPSPPLFPYLPLSFVFLAYPLLPFSDLHFSHLSHC